MTADYRSPVTDEGQELPLLVAAADDLVRELSDLALAVEQCLGRTADVDEVISLLKAKKSKVDTLNTIALEITSRLRSAPGGRSGQGIPQNLRARFRELMAAFRGLLDQESRIEDLIAGRGFPVSRRLR
jgi:hypothetical protein